MSAIHEDPHRRVALEPPTERSFGIVWSVVLGVIGAWPLLHGGPPRFWAFIAGGLLVLVTWIHPRLLRIPNLLWFRFGLLLGRVVSPIVIAVIFYVVITPFGVVMRLVGRDPLRLRGDSSLETYWLPRPSNPTPESMKDQF